MFSLVFFLHALVWVLVLKQWVYVIIQFFHWTLLDDSFIFYFFHFVTLDKLFWFLFIVHGVNFSNNCHWCFRFNALHGSLILKLGILFLVQIKLKICQVKVWVVLELLWLFTWYLIIWIDLLLSFFLFIFDNCMLGICPIIFSLQDFSKGIALIVGNLTESSLVANLFLLLNLSIW